MMLFGKICAISFDNQTENKLVFWQHVVFLLYALNLIVEVSMLFFVNPNEIYRLYIEPLNESPPKDTTSDYQHRIGYNIFNIFRSLEGYFFTLALSIKLLEWTEIENLVNIQRRYQHLIMEKQV